MREFCFVFMLLLGNVSSIFPYNSDKSPKTHCRVKPDLSLEEIFRLGDFIRRHVPISDFKFVNQKSYKFSQIPCEQNHRSKARCVIKVVITNYEEIPTWLKENISSLTANQMSPCVSVFLISTYSGRFIATNEYNFEYRIFHPNDFEKFFITDD